MLFRIVAFSLEKGGGMVCPETSRSVDCLLQQDCILSKCTAAFGDTFVRTVTLLL